MQKSRITDVLLTEHLQSSLLLTAGPSPAIGLDIMPLPRPKQLFLGCDWTSLAKEEKEEEKKKKEDKIYLKRGTERSISDSGGSRSGSNVKVELWWLEVVLPRFFHTRKHVKEVKGAFSSKEKLKENRQNGQDEADPRFYRVSSSRHTVLFTLSPGRYTWLNHSLLLKEHDTAK